MIPFAFTADVDLLVVHDPIDWRCGVNRIVALCISALGKDPKSRGVFLFRNRHSNSLKVLFYDEGGYWLAQKKLVGSKFKYWPSGNEPLSQLAISELAKLVNQLRDEPKKVVFPWNKN